MSKQSRLDYDKMLKYVLGYGKEYKVSVTGRDQPRKRKEQSGEGERVEEGNQNGREIN